MKKVIRLTESELIDLVKKVISEEKKTLVTEGLSSTDGKYTLSVNGGWLTDNLGNTMCVKVDAPWPIGTFAQGVKNAWKNKDGSGTIQPQGSKIGNIDMSKADVDAVLAKLKSGGTYKTTKSGATITIGKGLVSWCKKEWGS
jgi:hypothetical protein